MAKVQINNRSSMLIGRNGQFELTAIEMKPIYFDISNPNAEYAIKFFGKQNKPVRAGAYFIPQESLIELCKQFLEEHGYCVYEKVNDVKLDDIQLPNEVQKEDN